MKPAAVIVAPNGITNRGPNLSIIDPTRGANTVAATNPTENVAAIVALSHWNSSRIGANKREKNVLALTPMPRVIKAIATTTHP